MTWTPPNSGPDPYPGSQPAYPPSFGKQPLPPFSPGSGQQPLPAFPPASGQQPLPPFPPAYQQQPGYAPAIGHQQPHPNYPPHPGYQPGKRTGPARLSWRIAHSAWVVAPMVPFSCFSAVGFVYVGIRARRPAWWIAGIVYTVVANVCFFLGSEGAEDSLQQNLAFTIMFLLWPISVAHAFVINASWLRWRAGHVPWYAQSQQAPWAGAPAPVATPLPTQLQGVVPPPQQFYGGDSTPGPEPAPGPLPEPAPNPLAEAGPRPLPEPAPERLDVNTADERQLAAVPGLTPQRVADVMAARQARGAFTSLSEFAAVAGLAPHEFVAVRDRLSCEPPPQANESPFGRIVDV